MTGANLRFKGGQYELNGLVANQQCYFQKNY